jgi:hypothetical protein
VINLGSGAGFDCFIAGGKVGSTGHVVGGGLDEVEANVPADLDIHIVMDNASSHKTKLIRNWFAKRPRWHQHFTPTHVMAQPGRALDFRGWWVTDADVPNRCPLSDRGIAPFFWCARTLPTCLRLVGSKEARGT